MKTLAATHPHLHLIGQDWKDLYKAALLEDDNAKLAGRISEARNALAARAEAISQAGQIEEQDALDRAMYFLGILGNHPELIGSC